MFNIDYLNLDSCRNAMSKCKKTYNICAFLFFIPFIVMIILALFLILSMPCVTQYFIDLIFKCIIFFYGYYKGFSEKNCRCCYIALVVIGISTVVQQVFSFYPETVTNSAKSVLMTFSNIFGIYDLINSIAMAITIFIVSLVNNVYHKLEACEGFPYFNERFEEEKKEAKKDKYQEYWDELKSKNKGSEMDEI